MINDHYGIFRWGTAQMWWVGGPDEIAAFKKWVEGHVPSDHFGWFSSSSVSADFASKHISGWFNMEAWTFLINYWAKGKIGRYDGEGKILHWVFPEIKAVYGGQHDIPK